MLIKFDDKEYQFDLDEIDRVEASYIKRNAGMTILELQAGLQKVDPDALAAVYWLMMKQNGVNQDYGRLNFKIAKFANALVEAQVEQMKADGLLDEDGNPKETTDQTT